MTLPRRAALALSIAVSTGCAGRQAQAGDRAALHDAGPVELALVSADGERFGLAQLRGRPLLLFVFTTYDQASQLALTPLTSFLAAHAELQAIGIAAQPNPAALLPLYRDALAVPFPLVHEVEPQIVAGRSMLGPIETVPTYVLLDASGRVAGRHTGALTDRELEDFVDPVLP